MPANAVNPKSPSDPMRVLIAGGGVAALEAVLALRALAGDRVSIELLAPEPDFVYRPLAVTEPFRVGQVKYFPLAVIAEEAGATLRHGTLAAVDADAHVATTEQGHRLPYDVLVLAVGARAVEAIPGSLTFRGPVDGPALGELLAEARRGAVRRVAFVLPTGAAWALPLYELALLTRWHLDESMVSDSTVTLVTPEDAPLGLFGPGVSRIVEELLELRGVELRTESPAVAFENGRLHVLPDGEIEVDRVVALPQLRGVDLEGIPQDPNGFVETDLYGGVRGLDDVYAAGDMTTFPVKQGGIATQQADAVASAIAARAGAPVAMRPFRPVVRGLLLTGGASRFLRAEATGRRSTADLEPLWWPPAKIVGRHLAPFLARRLGIADEPPRRSDQVVPVNVELEYDSGVVGPLA